MRTIACLLAGVILVALAIGAVAYGSSNTRAPASDVTQAAPTAAPVEPRDSYGLRDSYEGPGGGYGYLDGY